MTNVLLINGHQPFPSSSGKLNDAFISRAEKHFTASGDSYRTIKVVDGWDIEAEIENQL